MSWGVHPSIILRGMLIGSSTISSFLHPSSWSIIVTIFSFATISILGWAPITLYRPYNIVKIKIYRSLTLYFCKLIHKETREKGLQYWKPLGPAQQTQIESLEHLYHPPSPDIGMQAQELSDQRIMFDAEELNSPSLMLLQIAQTGWLEEMNHTNQSPH